MGDDNWDDDYTSSAPVAVATMPSFGSKGRGIPAPVDDGWGDDTSYRGGGGGGRGGFSSSRPGRGGGGNRNGGDRGEDWSCSCGQSNFASRFKCFKCSEPKPGGGGGGGSNGYGGNSGGDWTCSCGVSNFASRFKCFKCYEPKPGGGGGASNGYGSRNGGGGGGGDRGEDWTCSCGASNFASRFKCFKCSEPKPGGGSNGFSSGGGGGGDRGNSKPGDWMCSCGASNFAKRDACFKCSDPKPEGAGGGAPGGADGAPFDPAKPPLYIPKDVDQSEDNLFSSGIQTGINFSGWENVEVKVSGDNPPRPIESFESAGLREILVKNLKKSNYTKPTPIQKYAIPAGLEGRDLMGCAQTGSGKTAAFLIPIMHHLLESPGELVTGYCAQPEVIICAPTRELVMQIHEVACKYAYSSVLKICLHYGGASSMHFNRQLEKGCNILVATMGRLKDILDRGRISLASVRFVVLDEADRMLDMGFLGDIQHVMQHSTMPDVANRQTLMFSATFPETIQKLAGQFMKNYIFIAVGIIGGASTDVVQTILEVPKQQKKKKLLELLREKDEDGVIVFVSTIRNADFIACYLCETEIATTSIHGSRLQSQREQAIHDFKTKKMKVLVATAVASRGLDIKGIRHVINYDLPQEIDEYVHRIGRTGRVGNKGRATSFYDPDQDGAIAKDLVRILEQAGQPVPEFLKSGGGGGGYGRGGDAFGARDIRHDPDAAPVWGGSGATEPEESWD
ncbi:hypothetical protein M8J77_022715 [Diaphorina citri]|nr:hypothetical protein M8J77_022715 [Diaphorina citri]